MNYHTFTNSEGQTIELHSDLTMEDMIRMGWTEIRLMLPDEPLAPHEWGCEAKEQGGKLTQTHVPPLPPLTNLLNNTMPILPFKSKIVLIALCLFDLIASIAILSVILHILKIPDHLELWRVLAAGLLVIPLEKVMFNKRLR